MREDWKSRIARLITATIVVAIVIGGFVLAWPNYQRSRSLRLQDVELDQRIAGEQRAIDELIKNRQRFERDDEFVQSIMRRRNRRVHPGERVFIFED